MNKTISWLAGISFGIGCIIILLGVISGVFLGRSIVPAILRYVDYWIIAQSFFLVSILFFVYIIRRENRKE